MTQKFIPAARFHILTPLFSVLLSIFGLGKRYRKSLLKELSFSQKRIRVMDAGCGTGDLAIEVKKQNPTCVLYGVDADAKILTIAQQNITKEKMTIHLREAFLQDLPFPDDSFDVVYSSLVFHHLKSEDKLSAMKEIHRILKKGGHFLLADFAKPKNVLLAPFSWFTVIFEEGNDNYKGLIPIMLRQAGFSKIEEKGRYWFNIKYWYVEK